MGRSLSVNFTELYNSSDTKGLLKANINYNDAKTGNFVRDSITNQQKIDNSSVNTFNGKATYTEPLSKRVFVELNYALRTTSSSSKRLSYDSSDNGKYETLNALYSSNYQFDVVTNTGGLTFRYNSKKLTASLGSDAGFTNFLPKRSVV